MNLLVYASLCLIWGTTWLAIKIGLADAPPVWSAALRFVLAVAVLYSFNALTGRKYPQGWRAKWRAAWPGIFTFYGSYALTYVGEDYITSALAAVLFAVMPFFVMALMPLMVKSEKIDLRSVLGVLVGFAGVIVIFIEPVDLGSKVVIGMALLVLSPVSAAFGSVSVKAYLHDEPVFPMITLQMTVGAVLLLATAAITEPFDAIRFTGRAVGAMVYLALLGSVVTFSGYYWLLKRVRLLTMSMIALITPIVAMLVGYLVLDEVLTARDYFGAALVLAGVLIVNVKMSRHRSEP